MTPCALIHVNATAICPAAWVRGDRASTRFLSVAGHDSGAGRLPAFWRGDTWGNCQSRIGADVAQDEFSKPICTFRVGRG